MTIDRSEPASDLDERSMLEGWLEYHRATLEWKCSGLPPDGLRERAVPPSTMSLLGLVRHMAEIERIWFRNALGGAEPAPIYYSDDDPDGDFDNVDDADIEQDFAVWHAECDHARALLAGIDSLDSTGIPRSDPSGENVTARWVLTHMIEEYARHNGHADLLRERVDGSTGD